MHSFLASSGSVYDAVDVLWISMNIYECQIWFKHDMYDDLAESSLFHFLNNNKATWVSSNVYTLCFAGWTWPELSGARFQRRTWPNRLMLEPVDAFSFDPSWMSFGEDFLCQLRLTFLPLPGDSLTGNLMHKSSFDFYFVQTPASQTSEVSALDCQRLLQRLAVWLFSPTWWSVQPFNSTVSRRHR